MDASVSPKIVSFVRAIAAEVDGVTGVEKCRIRKQGLHLAMDIHILGHDIAHQAKNRLLVSRFRINDVTVHVEPVRTAG